MPDLVPPMLPASGKLPTGPGWAVEFAWDGLRCIAYARPGRIQLLTVRDRSVTRAFPELRVLADKSPGRGMVLDGTVVALDETGVPSRRLLMRRRSTQRPGSALVADVPVGFFVSDLMWLDGDPTTALPYRRRRELIDDLGLAEQPVVLSPSWPASDADHVLRTAERYGLEGVFAKRLDSAYLPGRRSRDWLRVSLRRDRQVVVGGWTPARPDRPDTVAALLLGVPGPDGLRYVGRVGLGVGGGRHAIAEQLAGLRAVDSPFVEGVPAAVARDAQWAVPRLVGWVEFAEWTTSGRLRLPIWRGLVDPEDVDESLWADPGPIGDDLAAPVSGAGAGGPAAAEEAGADPGAEPGPIDEAGGRGGGDPAAGTVAGDDVAGDLAGDRLVDSGGAGPRPAEPEAGPADRDAPDGSLTAAAGPTGPPASPVERVQARRLEQHFVYNSLNTIAALVRTDPGRARELLLGFAHLTRAADQPAGASTRLRDELDSVRAYLQLEQARFGKRLTVAVRADRGLDDIPVVPMSVLAVVRAVVQQEIEPRPEGGSLRVSASTVGTDCVVTVVDDATGEPRTVRVGALPV
jgi:bifunctional non-homologous end joining protein LigD